MNLVFILIMAVVSAGGVPSDLSDLAWMAGSWVGSMGDLEIEELWMPPKGGMMLGLHRDVSKGRAVMFEYLRVELGEEGPVYVASPKGRPGTPFKLVESNAGRAVFENLEHDFPQRIIYWIDSGDILHARIEGPGDDGETASMEWVYRRSSGQEHR